MRQEWSWRPGRKERRVVNVWRRVANRIGFGVIWEGSVAFRREKASARRLFLQRLNMLDCCSDGSDIKQSVT